MRLISLALVAVSAAANTPAGELWADLKSVREKLSGVHQEFEVTETFRTEDRRVLPTKRHLVLDMAGPKWREASDTGPGARIRVFDGQNLLTMEEGGDEFVRTKRQAKDDDPTPAAYPNSSAADWSKAVESGRIACGFAEPDHRCIVVDVPLKPWARRLPEGGEYRMLKGTARASFDMQTALLVSLETVETLQRSSSLHQFGAQLTTRYVLKRMTYGMAPDTTLFTVPMASLREVKELSRWSAARIRKQLIGTPAPEFTASDMQGNPVTLAAYKGKIILMDFWATWCPPCRSDSPALEKLYRKYSDRDLMIVGISMSEDRIEVERFLKSHPHTFPTVLSSENSMPAAYHVSAIPTYVVVDRDGTVISAVEGDKGFSDLKSLLKKAGLEVE